MSRFDRARQFAHGLVIASERVQHQSADLLTIAELLEHDVSLGVSPKTRERVALHLERTEDTAFEPATGAAQQTIAFLDHLVVALKRG